MFTGFASENTPAIQVWDFFRTFASTAAVRSVSLPDDCAPIQVFRTGGSTTSIRVYLPTAPIEGKQITIVNQGYGSNSQSIAVYSSDVGGTGITSPIFIGGQSSSIVLVFSKQAVSFGTNPGVFESGWISLNQSSVGSAPFGSVIVGGDSHRVSSSYGFIGGGSSNTVNAQGGAAVGGSSNTASALNAAVVGGSSNTASNTGSVVLGGSASSATGVYSIIAGGNGSSATQNSAAVLGGQGNSSQGIYSVVVGGIFSTANAGASSVLGGYRGLTRAIEGCAVIPASNSPVSITFGGSQSAILVLGRETTDATTTVLRSNSSAATTTNQVILPNNSAYYVKGSVIATVTGGGNTKSWDFIATIKRGANAAATSIVGAVTLNVQAADAGASTWIVAITADTTNGGLAVTVTGQAATTIRWVAKLESTEVTY
jgi:hypothetical protein